MIKSALISDCKKYRYYLLRIWDDSKPKVLFLMHNPSTADAYEDDRTISRCIKYAKAWGYGGIYVVNLIPYRATHPSDLKMISFAEAMGDQDVNQKHINELIQLCDMHILAYGNVAIKGCVPKSFDDCWHYLKLTKYGNPRHPLYLRADLTPQKLNP